MVTSANPPQGRPLVVAHRGGSPTDVENSLASFQHALAIGADLIECDLRLSSDGSIVLYHDERIDGVKVSSLTVRELQMRVPTLVTLDDLLMLTAGQGVTSRLVLDLKERGIDRALISILERRPDIVRNVLVSTVHTASLRRLSTRFPELRLALSRGHLIAWLPVPRIRRIVARALRRVFPIWLAPQLRWCGAGTVAIHHRLIDEMTVDRYRKLGLRVYAWTVDDRLEAERVAGYGVDFIATNEPWEILGRFGRWPEET